MGQLWHGRVRFLLAPDLLLQLSLRQQQLTALSELLRAEVQAVEGTPQQVRAAGGTMRPRSVGPCMHACGRQRGPNLHVQAPKATPSVHYGRLSLTRFLRALRLGETSPCALCVCASASCIMQCMHRPPHPRPRTQSLNQPCALE